MNYRSGGVGIVGVIVIVLVILWLVHVIRSARSPTNPRRDLDARRQAELAEDPLDVDAGATR